MITTAQIGAISNGTLYDVDGDKVGSVGRVYLDNRTGEPEWVTVKTGLFGSRSTFVPLHEATAEGDDLHVPHGKATIKDAPRIDEDDELTPAQEDELYTYYGIQGGDNEGGDNEGGDNEGGDNEGGDGEGGDGVPAPQATDGPQSGPAPRTDDDARADDGTQHTDPTTPADGSAGGTVSSGTAKLRRYMGDSATPLTADGGRHEA